MNHKKNSILHINCIIGFFACIFEATFFSFYIGSFFWAVASLLCGSVFGIVFLLNKKEKHNLAKYLYFIFNILMILFYGLFMGEGTGVYFYYIPLLCSLFISYKIPQQNFIVLFFLIWIVLSSILLFAFEGAFDRMDFSKINNRTIYIFNFLMTMMVTVLSVYQLGIINSGVEKKLAASVANLQAVFDSSAEAKFLISKNLTVLDFNKSAAQQVLMSSGKKLKRGDHALDYISAASKENYILNFSKSIRGETVMWSNVVKTHENNVMYYEMKMNPVFNEENKIIGVSSRGTNITEKKIAELAAEEGRIMLRSIFDEVPDALFLVDPTTRQNLQCNKSAVNLFEVDSEEDLLRIKGSDLHKNPPSKELIESMSRKIRNEGSFEQELEYVTKKGNFFWENLVIKKINVVGVIYSLVRITDITEKVKEREKMTAFLELQKRDVENKNKQKNLALIIHGQEQERQRFSKELHDGIGQILTAVRLQVSALDVEDKNTFDTQKQKIKKTIDTTISEVKRISSNLMPSAIEDFGLVGALEHLCQLVPPTFVVEFEHDPQINEFKLSKNEQFAVYRIAQEAINNAIKYSEGSKIKVLYSATNNNELLLSVEDNGKGFKQGKILSFYENHTISSGLNNMRERAQLINANLLINSVVGEGTVINLFIPLHQ